MMNGDISNATPPRIIVVVDAVVEFVTILEDDTSALRKLFTKTPAQAKKVKWNNTALSHLWRVADNFGLSVELAAFADDGWVEADLTKVMDKLDARGGNPFNYSQVYDDFHELVGELPYRGNLKGVIDAPGRAARYGSWGLELYSL